MSAHDLEFAKTSWRVGDVQSLAPQLTDEQAEEFLANNEHHLRDSLISYGWTVLENLLVEEGIPLQSQDSEEEEEEGDD